MLKGKGKVWKATTKGGGQVIYIPSDVVKDSTYPFSLKEKVDVQLDPKQKKIIISKMEDTPNVEG